PRPPHATACAVVTASTQQPSRMPVFPQPARLSPMSIRPGDEKQRDVMPEGGPVMATIAPKPRDLGDNFMVRRALPAVEKRMVGPFIFWDEFGPTRFEAGKGLDVRPHPHLNLATVTYLFEGEIFHRDTLGSAQTIKPGDVNWMNAGRGI